VRIAWFTPFSRSSAIGRFSAAVTAELSRHAEVELWHPWTSTAYEVRVRQVSFRSACDIPPGRLDEYDLVIYNFGNHLPFHREIYEISRQTPGLCILHDFVMQHFFAAYFVEHLRQPHRYVQLMERHYGEPGRRAAEASLARRGPPLWETDAVMEFPLFEPAIQGAFGVITHAEFFRQWVEAVFAGPVARLHLPYTPPPATDIPPRRALGVSEERVLAVTVGHVNRNKRVRSVLEVLAKHSDLRARILYAVLGPADPDYERELRELIARWSLQDCVRLLGYVDDRLLAAYLHHADFCINLRFPVTEGASASLAEQMLLGKPVIVARIGCYQEIPDDCAVKVAPTGAPEELAQALRKLALDPAARQAIGIRAKEFADNHFQPRHYAQRLLDFAWQVRSAKPLLKLADGLASELANLGIDQATDQQTRLVQDLARECARLFGAWK